MVSDGGDRLRLWVDLGGIVLWSGLVDLSSPGDSPCQMAPQKAETMTLSFLLLCIWALVANILALIPSKRHHWPQAYALLAVGLPLLAYVLYDNEWTLKVVSLAIWLSVMRWPILYGYRWVRRKLAQLGDKD